MKKSFLENLQENLHGLFVFLQKFTYEIYIAIATTISAFLTAYYKIDMAFFCFILITSLDTITRVHAEAVKKKLIFNPFKAYFWREFKSDKFREMLNKIFSEYGVYLIIAFILDTLVFDKLLLNIYGQRLTLPVIALYLFSFIELWSIGENIDDAGGVNIFKRIVHLLPEKIRKIVEPEKENQ
jgi:hypothetical protein